MTTVAIRQTTWTGLTDDHRRLLQNAWPDPALGDPVAYKSESGAGWAVFDDPRIGLEQAAIVGAIASNWQLFPAGFQNSVPNDAYERLQWVKDKLGDALVMPEEITYSGDDDFQETLNAQGAPTTYVVLAQ